MKRASRVAFAKLEALGNDFVLIDARTSRFRPDESAIAMLADRRRGIGFDQLLVLRPSGNGSALCRVDVHNSDGSTAEQCGNGMRAIALWLHARGEFDRQVQVDTAAGAVELTYRDDDHITATLPPPDFSPAACRLQGEDSFPVTLELDGETLQVLGASMGNPHLVLVLPEPAGADQLQHYGAPLSRHPRLGAGANVGLASIRDRHRVDLSVYERGSGATPACGSGACAAAVALIRDGKADNPVEVAQPGGTLVINWAAEGSPVYMTGPARLVFEGVIPWAIQA